MRQQPSQFVRRPSPTPTPPPENESFYDVRPSVEASSRRRAQISPPSIVTSTSHRQSRGRNDALPSMNLNDPPRKAYTRESKSSYQRPVSSLVFECEVKQRSDPLYLLVLPTDGQRGRRSSNPLFEPRSVEIRDNFQGMLPYTSTNGSEDEAGDIDEPSEAVSQRKSTRQVKSNSIISTTTSRYVMFADDGNRDNTTDEANDSPFSSPQYSPEARDEDPDDDDYFEPDQSVGKHNRRTKTGRLALINTNDSLDEEYQSPVKRKRQRHPLMANLEIDREKYDFRLPFYFSFRRSLRGRNWTRVPVRLGIGHHQINSPMVRPLKVECIPGKRFHNKVKMRTQRMSRGPTRKSHGELNLS
jgi:hypothetical protein